MNLPEPITGEELLAKGPLTVLAIPQATEGEVNATNKESLASESLSKVPRKLTHGPKGGLWITRPSAPRLPNDSSEIWHYSDVAGFIGVISNSQLWATAVGNLNDTAESSYGRRLLEQLLIKVRDSRCVHPTQKSYLSFIVDLTNEAFSEEGLFVACASTAGHSLAQWRTYRGNQGHAVWFDPQQDLAVESKTDVANTVTTIPHAWKRVLYTEEQQRELLLSGLSMIAYSAPHNSVTEWKDNEAAQSHASLLAELVADCKEPSFHEEREVRMIVQAPSFGSIQFRASSTGVAPYLSLTGADRRSSRTTSGNNLLPIIRCVIGPFSALKSSAFAAGLLLKHHDYADVSVEVSTSTLRQAKRSF
ncbi:DUF2971 domain-containing protein [Glutamicibacter halophytocola]|uniref:DUF2971 domain-containing protein n=1 Tax=Glutamicibacter halophytocola TaxID=1933880 RepID=UPI0015C52AC3|nr:DUF2971 domain-containing protein [Glutamicibacter halophytocola]NQD41634.1 hypothetical protein [Glutamicibacter halophytocola]